MAGTQKTVNQRHLHLSDKKIAIVTSRWHEEITSSLHASAYSALLKGGIKKENIISKDVPGSFELPLAALREASNDAIDGVIALGCIIEGETPHFHYIAQAVTQGLMDASLKTMKPVSFGVLTTTNKRQAEDRSGGKWGNKGEEAAASVLEMLT